MSLSSAVLASPVVIPSVRAFFNTDYEAQHAANVHIINEQARERAVSRSNLIQFGLEANTCGFHIVEPPRNNTFSSADSVGVLRDKWDFWDVLPAYPEPGLPDFGLGPIAILASTERVFPNVVATASVEATGNGWGVRATFEERGLDIVKALHGPKSSATEFHDWYGQLHNNGGWAPEMKAALIADDVALRVFSVTDLVDQAAPASVLVAEDLSLSDAEDLVEKYKRS
ncbi:MAG: hypothetical protein R3F33_17795 [Planctomycetota bacterium]